MTDSSASSAHQWIIVLSLAALLLSLAVLAQIAGRYAKAYFDAPGEVSAFLDAVDSSIAENESYDLDIARVQRLEDKLRLGRLLREIQKGGDALREELSALVVGENDPRLLNSARMWWASHRLRLEERVRRLDLLRMRFLVVHMGIIAAVTAEVAARKDVAPRCSERCSEKSAPLPQTPRPAGPAGFPKSLVDSIKSKPPLRKLNVQPISRPENVDHRRGWAGVVLELQKSPLLRERHASIELAMSSRSP